jgi:2-oxoglutarate ferredoxin oxidoreductase subunit delta
VSEDEDVCATKCLGGVAGAASAAPRTRCEREEGLVDDSPVVIDLTTCKTCGICVGVCPKSVFDTDERGHPVVARPDDCTACLLCEWHCPDFAIEVRRRKAAKKAHAAIAAGTGEVGAAAGAPDDADTERVAGALAAAHDAQRARGNGRGCGED